MKYLKNIPFLFLLFFNCERAFANDWNNIYKCESDNKKVVLDFKKNEKKIRYTYFKDDKIELSVVDTKTPFYYSERILIGGGANYVRFNIGKYHYFIYTVTMNSDKGKILDDGVMVVNDKNKIVFYIPCSLDKYHFVESKYFSHKEEFFPSFLQVIVDSY